MVWKCNFQEKLVEKLMGVEIVQREVEAIWRYLKISSIEVTTERVGQLQYNISLNIESEVVY